MRIRFVSVLACAGALLIGSVAPTTVAAAAPKGATTAITPKIAAYNVFMLSRNLYPNWGQLTRADLIDRENVLAGQDVVVLNEVFDNGASDRLLGNLADTYPNQTPVLGRSRTGWDATLGAYSGTAPEDGGVSVISRWPIARKVQYVYAQSCGVEVYSNKGFVYVKLTTPSGPLHVIGTHQQADDGSCSVSPASVRASQRAELRKFLDAQRIPATEPLYVAGDMNVIEAGSEYAAMLRELDAKAPAHTGHPYSWDCNDNSICRDQYGTGYDSQHLDYVLPINGHPAPSVYANETRRAKSSQWSVSSWGQTYTYTDYSDHYPVFGAAG